MKDVVSECPIEQAMQLLSGRWPALLLYYLKDGVKRFSDLQRDNPTVSHRILTLELRELEDAGVVRRTVHEGYPLRVEYSLAPAGLQLVPLIDALGDWWADTAQARQAERAARSRDPQARASISTGRRSRTLASQPSIMWLNSGSQ